MLSSGSGFFNTIFWVLHFIFNCQQNPYSSVAVSSSLGGFSGRFFKANKSFSFGITLLLSFLTPFSFFFLFFLDVTSAAATFPSFLCFFLFYQLSLKLIIFSFLSGWCGLFFYGTATTFFLFITLLLVEMVLFLVTTFFFLTSFLDESMAFYFFWTVGASSSWNQQKHHHWNFWLNCYYHQHQHLQHLYHQIHFQKKVDHDLENNFILIMIMFGRVTWCFIFIYSSFSYFHGNGQHSNYSNHPQYNFY